MPDNTLYFVPGMYSHYGKTPQERAKQIPLVESQARAYAEKRGMNFKSVPISADDKAAQRHAVQALPLKKGDAVLGFSGGGYTVANAKLSKGVEKIIVGAPKAAGNLTFKGSHMEQVKGLAGSQSGAPDRTRTREWLQNTRGWLPSERQSQSRSVTTQFPPQPPPVSTGAQGAANRAAGLIRDVPGKSSGVDPRLRQLMSGAIQLFEQKNPGYRVQVTSGYRANEQGPGTRGPHSKHEAMDVQIIGPNGVISNKGSDPTGKYRELARISYGHMLQTQPELNGRFAWGGAFGTKLGGGGPPDIMHFDLMGERGHIASARLSNMGPLPGVDYGRVQTAAYRSRPQANDIWANPRGAEGLTPEPPPLQQVAPRQTGLPGVPSGPPPPRPADWTTPRGAEAITSDQFGAGPPSNWPMRTQPPSSLTNYGPTAASLSPEQTPMPRARPTMGPTAQPAMAPRQSMPTVEQLIRQNQNNPQFAPYSSYASMIPDQQLPIDQWKQRHADLYNNPMVPQGVRSVFDNAMQPQRTAPGPMSGWGRPTAGPQQPGPASGGAPIPLPVPRPSTADSIIMPPTPGGQPNNAVPIMGAGAPPLPPGTPGAGPTRPPTQPWEQPPLGAGTPPVPPGTPGAPSGGNTPYPINAAPPLPQPGLGTGTPFQAPSTPMPFSGSPMLQQSAAMPTMPIMGPGGSDPALPMNTGGGGFAGMGGGDMGGGMGGFGGGGHRGQPIQMTAMQMLPKPLDLNQIGNEPIQQIRPTPPQKPLTPPFWPDQMSISQRLQQFLQG